MNEVSVDGTRIRYIEKGEGTPLVLVHGIPTSSFLWRDMIEELSSYGRVIAPDLPGFGLSDPPPNGDYSISSYAGLLESFLESLSITEATLVCHDFGGPITVTYALRNPDKYARLVILNTFLDTDLPNWGLLPKLASIRPVGEILMKLGGKSITRAGLEAGVVDKSRISNEVFHRYYMADGSPGKVNETYLGTLRADSTKDLKFIEDNLHTIDKPTLIIWAEEDSYLPLRLGERIHEHIEGSAFENAAGMRSLPARGRTGEGDETDHRVSRQMSDKTLLLRNGRKLAYAEYGDPDGCPVMLFHGNPSSRLSWGLIPGSPFRPHVRLIAPDRPGFGRSDFQPGRRLLDWPDDVCELADALELNRFAVLGVSGGGPATLACAWKIPAAADRGWCGQ